MFRAPPISTLFPYTTLFRSKETVITNRHELDALDSEMKSEGIPALGSMTPALSACGGLIPFLTLSCYRDRKSTRLNSSHGYISYAVFCLKKKKRDSMMSRFV